MRFNYGEVVVLKTPPAQRRRLSLHRPSHRHPELGAYTPPLLTSTGDVYVSLEALKPPNDSHKRCLR